jgi:hypothetical protein
VWNGSIGRLGWLPARRQLVADNQLSGNLSLFGALSNLEVLSIAVNNFSGRIPTGLSNLTKLKVLAAYNNQLSGVRKDTLTDDACNLLISQWILVSS